MTTSIINTRKIGFREDQRKLKGLDMKESEIFIWAVFYLVKTRLSFKLNQLIPAVEHPAAY